MKVDFLGPTNVLQNLLGTPTVENQARAAKPPEFKALLEQLDPKARELNINSGLGEQAEKQSAPGIAVEKEPMARYSFEAPELIAPKLTPQPVPELPRETAPESVKSPTVLSVRRMRINDDLALAPHKERVSRVAEMVSDAGKEHGVDPTLGMAVVKVESSFDPSALSSDGHFSKGLFQLLDSTAQTIIDRDGLQDSYVPYEPNQNVDLGVRYLRYLHDLFTKPSKLSNGHQAHPTANSSSLEKLAVAAFNAGEGRVAASQGAALRAGEDPGIYEHVAKYLPESTQEYVQKVLAAKHEFSSFEPSI